MRVAVIGAGVGGMVAALRLAKAGHEVTVFEQGGRVGGKLNVWDPDVPGIGRFRFDTGPHVLTMPWAIRELFADLDECIDDHLDLVRVDPVCRYHLADGSVFDLPGDPERAVRAVGARFPGDEQGFRALLDYARRVHDVTVDPFLRQDFGAAVRGIPSPRQWAQLGAFLGLRPWRTLHDTVASFVRHPELRHILDLYALYNGSSPYQASGIFAIIAWVQIGGGTFTLRGGLRTYADALMRLAKTLGVTVRTETTISGIAFGTGRQGRPRATGVTLDDGLYFAADAVISNADPLTTYAALVPRAHCPPAFSETLLARYDASTSAFVLLLGLRDDCPPLAHYNGFLPANPDAEVDAVFGRGVPADDPVVGVTCPSVTEPDCAPPGHTALFVMTSPPALGPGFEWSPTNTAAYRDRVLAILETRGRMPGLRERIVCEQVWTPEDFARRYGAYRGSLYGLSSNRWRSAFLRPPNVAPNIDGLFFVGGGTHPGGGLPLVTLSGKIVADAVSRDA